MIHHIISQEQGDKVTHSSTFIFHLFSGILLHLSLCGFSLPSLVLFLFEQVGETRALYNIGNVFHAKGKQELWGCTQEPGDLLPDVRDTLQKATGFYE